MYPGGFSPPGLFFYLVFFTWYFIRRPDNHLTVQHPALRQTGYDE